MKSTRVLLSLYFGFAVYSTLLFLYGSSGTGALEHLQRYRAALSAHVESLSGINETLTYRLESLLSDAEAVRLRSRELGYFSNREHIILVSGYRTGSDRKTAGAVLARPDSVADLSHMFRAAGAASAILAYCVLLLFGKRE